MGGISKRFGGTQALRSVDLTAESGEVHAIVGENGAGKSTLSRILTGAVQCDAGEIRLGGEPQAITSPLRGQQLGIRMVAQHANLVPNLSVTENVLLGAMPTGRFGWWIDWAAAHRRVQQILERIGFQGIDVRRRVARLSAGAAPGRGDRQGRGGEAEDPDHGRALGCARAGRPDEALRAHPAPARGKRADLLHLASPRRAVRDRRPRHGAQGRRARRHRGSAPHPTRRADPPHGRPPAAGHLSPPGSEIRPRAAVAARPRPCRQLQGCLVHCGRRRDRRAVRPRGQRPHRGRTLRLRRRSVGDGRDPRDGPRIAPALAARCVACRDRHAYRGPDRRRPGSGAVDPRQREPRELPRHEPVGNARSPPAERARAGEGARARRAPPRHRAAGAQAERRQPAEGGAREMAPHERAQSSCSTSRRAGSTLRRRKRSTPRSRISRRAAWESC